MPTTKRAEFYGNRYDGLVKTVSGAAVFYRFPLQVVPVTGNEPRPARPPALVYKLNGEARPGVLRYDFEKEE